MYSKKRKLSPIAPIVFLLFFCSQTESTYTVENIDGVRHVHNDAPLWGNEPKIGLEFVQKIGDLDATDEAYQLFNPRDVVVDKEGTIFVSDVGNTRIQKYSADGKYLGTFGRQGRGPGEFEFAQNLDTGLKGYIYAAAIRKQRIIEFDNNSSSIREFNVEGMPTQRELTYSHLGMYYVGLVTGKFHISPLGAVIVPERSDSGLLRVHDMKGGFVRHVGETISFVDDFLKRRGNETGFDVDKDGYIYVSFYFRNRIEKYSPDGVLMMRIDRPLDYAESTQITVSRRTIQAVTARTGQPFRRQFSNFEVPNANVVSSAIAVDGRGRIWIETYKKQPDFTKPIKRQDYVHLEIFDKEGILLGNLQIPVNSEAMRIFDDRIFFVDSRETMSVYEYKIVEK